MGTWYVKSFLFNSSLNIWGSSGVPIGQMMSRDKTVPGCRMPRHGKSSFLPWTFFLIHGKSSGCQKHVQRKHRYRLARYYALPCGALMWLVTKIRKLVFHFHSNWIGYDRSDRFPFDFEPNQISIGSKKNYYHDHIPFTVTGNENIVLWV